MKGDNERIGNFLIGYGLRIEEFKEAEKTGKNPDFRVFKGNRFAFFCEVKTISPDERWGILHDSTFNMLTNKIHTAIKQFNAVNPQLEYPNVLAFVNHDRRRGWMDLYGVLTGGSLADGGGHPLIYLKFSEGRIRDEKEQIHLYIWIDDFKGNLILFNFSYKKHFCGLCRDLDVDPKSVNALQ